MLRFLHTEIIIESKGRPTWIFLSAIPGTLWQRTLISFLFFQFRFWRRLWTCPTSSSSTCTAWPNQSRALRSSFHAGWESGASRPSTSPARRDSNGPFRNFTRFTFFFLHRVPLGRQTVLSSPFLRLHLSHKMFKK